MAGGGRRTENWNKDNPTGGEYYPPRHVPQSSLAHMYLQPPNASVVVVELCISRSAGDYHLQRTTIFRVIYTKRFT